MSGREVLPADAGAAGYVRKPAMTGPTDSGVYIVVFRLVAGRVIEVGKLGWHSFDAGVYLYVGSAQRNLSARLARHARRDKVLRWHVDYLSVQAQMLGAMILPGPKTRECELAELLSELFEVAVPRFGSSDCRCASHLFYSRYFVEVGGNRDG